MVPPPPATATPRHRNSSVDAKLQAICKGLANSHKQGKQGKKTAGDSSMARNESDLRNSSGNLSNCDLGFPGSDDTVKVEASRDSSPSLSYEYSAGSSPESDISFFDFLEPWIDEWKNFMLEMPPPLDIDRSSEMATPHNVELEAAKFLHKLIQESKDDPRKLATKLYVILEHMRLNGKDYSMPYQVISRAMETLINVHGLDIEALKSSHVPLTGGTLMGDSSETQLAEEEDTIKTQERQHKKTCVRISIPLDEILQCSKMSRHGAAKKLEVSISTLKRVCRDYGIHRWPPRNKNKVRTPRSSSVVRLGEIPQFNPDPPSNQVSAGVANTKPHDTTTVGNVNVMTVKAKYVNDITIKFQLSLPPELVELRQQVAKRLDLEPGTYHIKYKDEDGDLILIGCDEDLKDYIHNSTLQGSTAITLLLEPK